MLNAAPSVAHNTRTARRSRAINDLATVQRWSCSARLLKAPSSHGLHHDVSRRVPCCVQLAALDCHTGWRSPHQHLAIMCIGVMQWPGCRRLINSTAMAAQGHAAQQGRHTVVPWFRNDLRLHDSAILHQAAQLAEADSRVQVRCGRFCMFRSSRNHGVGLTSLRQRLEIRLHKCTGGASVLL